MSNHFANKCFGCEHYDGFVTWDNSRTIAKCTEGRNARISSGCSAFLPDITASCYDCIYYNHFNCKKGNDTKKYNRGGCYDFAYKDEITTKTSNDNKGCFITTSVCESQGLADNCYELEMLRKYRDTKLMNDNNYAKLVYKYYEIAPKLVYKLENNIELSNFLYSNYIAPIVCMIEENQKIKVIVEKYEEMVAFLQRK